MSVKIKINWDNENVVSESVRIYRADSGFTSTSLPPLLAEIVGDVYEYEDLTTVENQTYFYMLSAKLDEQEVFTDCFEVVADATLWVDTNEFLRISLNNLTSHHLLNGSSSLSSMGANLSDGGKLTGGVLGGDGKIYCVPYNSTDILIIDPASQTATRSNMGANLSDSLKWSGGVLGGDGKIYCVPRNPTDILRISMNQSVPIPPLKYCLSPHINKF